MNFIARSDVSIGEDSNVLSIAEYITYVALTYGMQNNFLLLEFAYKNKLSTAGVVRLESTVGANNENVELAIGSSSPVIENSNSLLLDITGNGVDIDAELWIKIKNCTITRWALYGV